MKRIITLLSITALFMGIISCNDTDKDEFKPADYTISGKVEKGPFISGSTINLQPMDSKLVPTGSTFTTTITDNSGNFSFGVTTLDSPYAQLTTNGYFYNEITGALSSGTLTLRALADLGEQSTVNVNILTHLKYARIQDLVTKDNKSYTEANKQAQIELLSQFGLQRFADTDAINYSITSGTPEAGALIAISSLVLKNRNEAQITEYLAKLSKEFGEAGAFSEETKAIIKNDRQSLIGDLRRIENNIRDRYKELGQTVTVDSLEYYFDWDDDSIAGNEVFINLEEKLIGTWQATDGFYYTFNDDNTGYTYDKSGHSLSFTWSLSSQELEMKFRSSGQSGKTAYLTFIIQSVTDTTITVYDKNDPNKQIIILTHIGESLSYEDLKELEAQNIRKWINDHNIDVLSLNEFLKDTITNNPITGPDYTRNEYVLFPNYGVYMQIVKRGEGSSIKPGEQLYYNARFIEVSVSNGDTLTMNLYQSVPDVFYVKRTGDNYYASFINRAAGAIGIMSLYYGYSVPNAWVMSFPYIKPGILDGGASKIRLIVPHNQGTQTAAANVYPTFYEIIITAQRIDE